MDDGGQAIMLQPRSRLTTLQYKFLEILLDEYGGVIPRGELASVADRVGCAPNTLSGLLNGTSQPFTEELQRRLVSAIPMGNSDMRILFLQNLLGESIEQRKKRGVMLTRKDPVEIVEAIRKERVTAPQAPAVQNQTVFAFINNYNDEELAERIRQIEDGLRSGRFLEEGDDIDGELA